MVSDREEIPTGAILTSGQVERIRRYEPGPSTEMWARSHEAMRQEMARLRSERDEERERVAALTEERNAARETRANAVACWNDDKARVAALEAGLRDAAEAINGLLATSAPSLEATAAIEARRVALTVAHNAHALLGGVPAAAPEPEKNK